MVIILILFVWSFSTLTIYQILKIHQKALESLGLLVPGYSFIITAAYRRGYVEINEVGCFMYSIFGLLTIPFTAFHYYCVVPFISWLGTLGGLEDDKQPK